MCPVMIWTWLKSRNETRKQQRKREKEKKKKAKLRRKGRSCGVMDLFAPLVRTLVVRSSSSCCLLGSYQTYHLPNAALSLLTLNQWSSPKFNSDSICWDQTFSSDYFKVFI